MDDQHRVSLVFHEVLPQSQRIARFHHDGFPRERKPGRISRVALQEVSSGRPDRSYISMSVFHS